MSYDIFSDLPRIADVLLHQPWMVLPSFHQVMVDQLEAYRGNPAAGVKIVVGGKKQQDEKADGYVNRLTTFDKASGLGMISVEGVIGKKLGMLDMMCGGVDLNDVEDGLEKLADLKPTAVQLYLDTPGGTVTGVAEAAAAVEEFAATVAPVHAYVDVMCCSAGEWLSSAATSRSAAGTAVLGSIGVYSAMFDQSGRYENAGVKVHLATSGPLKGAGYPGVRPTDRQLEALQAEVSRLASDFYGQMERRQSAMGRAPLDPAVHFTGGTFRASTTAGTALVDAIIPSRAAHVRAMASLFARR